MIPDTLLNDSPIATPDADAYGFDPFAAALARGIARMSAPEGFVIALDGPWGSGKSSVVNLLRHHLRTDVSAGQMDVVAFSPWWFAGAEAMTRGFFEMLADTVKGSLKGKSRKKAKEAVQGVFNRIRPGKAFAAMAGDVAAGGLPLGSAALALTEAGMERLGAKRSLADEYARLTEALQGQDRRTLVVVDDIDRLDPDEAMLVFQLMKSVGRLPNVLYLLAFDGTVAARHLERRFGTTGADYLDKIVQVTYGLPVPDGSQLLKALIVGVGPLLGDIGPPPSVTRFHNLLHDCVAPLLKTPRDVVRLINAVTVGWPAIAGEANAADFLALEAIKLSYPEVYRAIQRSASYLCGLENRDHRVTVSEKERSAEYDSLLFGGIPEINRAGLRIALRRLFPRLESVYSNSFFGPGFTSGWHKDRLACSAVHFGTYFQLSPSREILSSTEIASLVSALSDTPRLREIFRLALTDRRGSGGASQASLLLEELRLRVDEIPVEAIQPMLQTLFELADDIDIPEDDVRGLSGSGNQLRLYSVVHNLLPQHLDQEARTVLLLSLAPHGQVAWLSYLAAIVWSEHHPHDPSNEVLPDRCLVTLDGVTALRERTVDVIRRAATTGELIRHPKLQNVLFTWAELAGDDGAQTRRWTRARLDEDQNVLIFAKRFMFFSESYALGGYGSLGDRVATRMPHVDRATLARICDIARLDERVTSLLSEEVGPEDQAVLEQFMKARKPGFPGRIDGNS